MPEVQLSELEKQTRRRIRCYYEAKVLRKEMLGEYHGHGLTAFDRYNNLHPDQRHRNWLRSQGLYVLKDGRTRWKK